MSVRGREADRLLDRKPRFAIQKSEYPLNVMNCSLNKLLNLHSTQPAVAGSATFQAVHQFTETTFNFRMLLFDGSIFIRLPAFTQNSVFRFVVIKLHTSAMLLTCRDTLLHQRTSVACLFRESKRRGVTCLIALAILRVLTSGAYRMRSIFAEFKLGRCEATAIRWFFGRNEGRDPARLQFTNQRAIETGTVDRDLFNHISMSRLFLIQQIQSISGFVAVRGQNVDRREQFTVGIDQHIREIAIVIFAMLTPPSIGINSAAKLDYLDAPKCRGKPA